VHDVRRRVLGHDAFHVAVPREVALCKRDRLCDFVAGDPTQSPSLAGEVERHAGHAFGHELAQHPGTDAALAAGDQKALRHAR
jgi:hypothetical protein